MINIARLRSRLGPVAACVLVLIMAAGGCGGGGEQQQSHQVAGGSPADAHPPAASSGNTSSRQPGGTTLAGVTFNPPQHWRDLGSSGMRQAQYRLAPVEGDAADAEVNVFYFGPQSGGGVEANLTRWIGQMVLPDGGDPAKAARRSAFTADGMAGHVVTMDGSYKSGGGRPMGGGGELLSGYRLVGVVLEGPQGSLFFKLTGPVATAKAMEEDLLEMVEAAHR